MNTTFNKMKIGIIGSGNVARALVSQLLLQDDLTISGIWSKTPEHAASFATAFQLPVVNQLSELHCDLAIICISENALDSVVNEASQYFPCAVSSGTFFIPTEVHFPVGIFYPLQTFSATTSIPLKDVHFFVSAQIEEFQNQLLTLGKQLGKDAHVLTDEQRQHLHIAAIFANNFTNHLLYLSEQYALEHALKPEWLKPLIEQTFEKLKYTSTKEAQTGPARRGSKKTLESHIEQLNEPYRTIYETLSKSLLNTYQSNEKL